MALFSKLFGRSDKQTQAVNTKLKQEEPNDQHTTNNVRDLVVAATAAVFNDKDGSAVDRYFATDYKQHSQLVGDGRGSVPGLGGQPAGRLPLRVGSRSG